MQIDNVYFYIIIFIFLLFLFIPFTPGLLVLIFGYDKNPLYIKLSYIKDHSFFGKSFYYKFYHGLVMKYRVDDLVKLPLGITLIEFSKKPEPVMILNNRIKDKFLKNTLDNVVLLKGNTIFDKVVNFKKEVVVLGNLTINEKSFFKALYVKGNLEINSPVKILRWIHIEGNLTINAETDLGRHCYVKDNIFVNSTVRFKRVFSKKLCNTKENLDFKEDNSCIILDSISVKKDLEINYKNKGVIVEGSLFSEKDIYFYVNTWVKDLVYSRKVIYIKDNFILGQENKIKTLFAQEKLVILGKVIIYGYIHTEGVGIIKV